MINEINATLDSLVREKTVAHNLLYQAARYSLLSEGKRIRPQLTIGVGQMLGAPLNHLLVPSCALELIHTYSLIHDDLPAMDDDDFRRGKPSLHKAFGEAEAILTGDFLLTYAFEILSEAPHIDDATKVKLIKTLAHASGGDGMVGGQLLDISKKSSRDEINAKKTGALFTAAVEFGAIIAKAREPIFSKLTQFGQKIGLLFQLCDDILDGEDDALKQAYQKYEELIKILDDFPQSVLLKDIAKTIINQLDLPVS